jgi:hypothetical protein
MNFIVCVCTTGNITIVTTYHLCFKLVWDMLGWLRNLQSTSNGYLGIYSGCGAIPSISVANNLKAGIYKGNPTSWLDVNGDIKCENIIMKLPSGNGWIIDGQNNTGSRAVGLYANAGEDGQIYLYNNLGNLRVKFDSNVTNFCIDILSVGAISTAAQLYVKNIYPL